MAVKPTLQPAEIDQIRHAAGQRWLLTRSRLPLGSWEARAGKQRLFCTGSKESFDELWRQAEDCYKNNNPKRNDPN